MSAQTINIVNWNVQWRLPKPNAVSVLRERIWSFDPEIVCLAETYEAFVNRPGHVITSSPDYGYPMKDGRRKVLLWSKRPWTAVDQVGSVDLPSGRFIRGRTNTSIGELDVVGVCIPWAGAHVSSGRRDRRSWEDHVSYLNALAPFIASPSDNMIVLGDYNQRIPRDKTPMAVYQALETAILANLQTPTAGMLEPLNIRVIDHVSHTPGLASVAVQALSNLNSLGQQISDHVGLAVVLARSGDAPVLRRGLERIAP